MRPPKSTQTNNIMNRRFFIIIAFLLGAFSCDQSPVLEIRQGSVGATASNSKVAALLAEMTLEEKVGQMAQITLDVITKGDNEFSSDEPLTLDLELVRGAIVEHQVGSVLNTANNRARSPEKWREVINQLQEVALNETRLGIPIIYGIDAIHGATYTAGATFFPQQIGQAATWNRELVRRAAEITAYETRASNIPWIFSPVLDLGRDPRFPRMWETFGEDVYLATELGREMVLGYEGEANAVNRPDRVASCLKHYLGYSVPNSGKDRTPAFIPELELRERHLAPFKAAVEAGAQSVMVNSSLINGLPVHANQALLTDLLKGELGFKGVVVSDWRDIDNLHSRDKVAGSRKEAVKLAINAGIDMSMIPYDFDFCGFLVELVREGEVPMARIDDAVTRILNLKMALGLFDRPTTDLADYPEFGGTAFEQTALATAAESITLLKNENALLPLPRTARVLVTGPNANSMRTLNGGWSYSWQGEKVEEFAAEYHTFLEAVQQAFGQDRVVYEPGVVYNFEGSYWEEEVLDMEAAAAAARTVDYVLLCLGENSYCEKPGDLHDLALSERQIQLAKAVAAAGKPVILILNEGRPRLISAIEPDMAAVLQTYLPSNYGGDALAAILIGDVNPSGKLPYTYPMFANSLLTYDHKPSEEQNKMEGVYDYESDYAVQYPFGFGLSYTDFTYGDLELSSPTMLPDGSLTISVTVKNTGKRAGKEVVQLYVSDLFASITPDVKRLRGFEKVELEPGASARVSFVIDARDIAFVNYDNAWTVEEGEFEVSIADQKKRFVVTGTQVF